MNDASSLALLSECLIKRQQQTGARHLLVLTDSPLKAVQGDKVSENALISTLAKAYGKGLLISRAHSSVLSEHLKHIDASEFHKELGSEYELVILDTYAGWNLNLLYASSGLVKQSGLLVLLTPKADDWSQHYAVNTAIKFSYGDDHRHSYASDLLLRAFKQDEACLWLEGKHDLERLRDAGSSIPPFVNSEHAPKRYQQQDILVEHIQQSWTATRSGHFISGGRGRGKSMLLARLASRGFATNRFKRIIICAPTHAQREIVQGYIKQGVSSEHSLLAIAPDRAQIIQNEDLLLLDEAAMLAPLTLENLIRKTQHFIIASTVEGYEGSGKGLLYRWLPAFASVIEHHELHQALRWHQDDPLEHLMQGLFQAPLPPLNTDIDTEGNLYLVDKLVLAEDKACFHSCFSLLQAAHYQSTANDILRLLDAQDHMLWVYRNKDEQTLGLICTISEGGEDCFTEPLLRQKIADGQRRVQGHLSVQALAASLHTSSFLQKRVLRIHRIAVHPSLQRRGVGTRMLECLHSDTKERHYDAYSTVFGMTEGLNRFWQKAGYRPFKLGQRVDTSSGTVSAYYLHHKASIFKSMVHESDIGIYLDLNYLQAYQQDLYHLIPVAIKQCYVKSPACADIERYMHNQLQRFVSGTLSLAMCRSALHALGKVSSSRTLLSAFDELHQKHHSKEKKQALESTIIDAVEEYLLSR